MKLLLHLILMDGKMVKLRDFSPICSILGQSIRKGTDVNKQIALTFDDGPHPYITPKILEVLERYCVKASFFVVGDQLEKFPNITRQAYQLGHTIGNHTYSHRSLLFAGRGTALAEIRNCDKIITQIIGERAYLFRPPFGLCNLTSYSVARQLGYKVVYWSIDPKDWESKKPATILEHLIAQIHSGAIVLFHDNNRAEISKERTATIVALELAIPILQSYGYDIVSLDKLLQLGKYSKIVL
jgi:peptidoglycan/xylan/chitin deacetylase (PgdA/CDA1 family)